ncbi:biotin/lipoyl-binding protein, partial [Methylobacterium sp. J-078]|uniref:biotin/lipoyl-binding protein n=1 Tax=Methylobacterium sp. J-078 TaxID=2836657 RepID=UPI001FB881EB
MALALDTGPAAALDLPRPTAQGSIRRHLALGLGLGVLLVVGVGGWATLTQISGAVIAPGQLVVESDVKKVQHPTGGVVGELLVREGARVKAGDVLIRLDETQVRANLDIVLKAMDELAARRARDEAERDGAERIAFPPELLARRDADPGVAHLIEGETRLFTARLAAREGQKAQLGERVQQLREGIKGLGEQVGAKAREVGLITGEPEGGRELCAKNRAALARRNAPDVDAARARGAPGLADGS